MNPNILPSNRVHVVAAIDPDANAVGTVTTGWFSMADRESVMAVIMAGTLGASAGITAKFEQATSAAGADAKDVNGKAITAITDSDSQAIINMHAQELDIDGGFTHARLSFTTATATSDGGALVLGFDSRYVPADHAASVVEVVA